LLAAVAALSLLLRTAGLTPPTVLPIEQTPTTAPLVTAPVAPTTVTSGPATAVPASFAPVVPVPATLEPSKSSLAPMPAAPQDGGSGSGSGVTPANPSTADGPYIPQTGSVEPPPWKKGQVRD
jgi:hypothetical protein